MPCAHLSIAAVSALIAFGCTHAAPDGSVPVLDGDPSCPASPATGSATREWHAPERLDLLIGGYGTAAYAPDGTLFVTWSAVGTPDALRLRRRSAPDQPWSAESTLSTNGRTAHLLFASSGKVYAAVENSGTALVYVSEDRGANWSWVVSYSAKDFKADPVFDHAFLVEDGDALQLFFGYQNFNAVVGNSSLRLFQVTSDRSSWPVNPVPQWPATKLRYGVQGAFSDGTGRLLVAATQLGRSDDHGATLTPLHLADDATALTNLAAASRHPTNGSVFLAELKEDSPTSQRLVVWRTDDLGANLIRLVTTPSLGELTHAAVAASKEVVVAAATVSKGQGASAVIVTTSTDRGCTWSTPTELVDVSGEQGTLNATSLAGSPDGRIALVYSVQHKATRDGVFLREWY
jgi:hypothetical protein